jgi:hypothetical protein
VNKNNHCPPKKKKKNKKERKKKECYIGKLILSAVPFMGE